MTMNSRNIHSRKLRMGPSGYREAAIRFTPAGTGTTAPTVGESHGFVTTGANAPSQTSTGVMVLTIAPDSGPVIDIEVVQLKGVPGDANFHSYDYTVSIPNRTITVTHKSCTYATIVSAGPVASATSGEITLIVNVRTSN